MSIKPIKKKTNTTTWWSRLNSWLHLWLGIASGIVVIIVAITGTLFVYCDEIIDLCAGKHLRVQEVKAERMSPEALLAAFKEQMPENHAFYFVQYKDASRTFKVASEDKHDTFQFSWMDPYTGKVLTTTSSYYFFYVVAHIHSGETPFGSTGNLIVQIATWIFLIELITGLVLWWPKKWTPATRKQSFTIKWKGSFKRVNYDLHNVPGFYSLIPALLLSVTGLLIVNHLLKDSMHKALGGNPKAWTALRKQKPSYESGRTFAALQPAIDRFMAQGDHIREVRMAIPASDSATSYYAVAARELGLKGMHDGTTYAINRYTGEPMALPIDIAKGLQIEGTLMNLHIGYWWGFWGKIIALITGLVCTALPITGFLIWWGRRNKKKKKTNEKAIVADRAVPV